MKNVYKQYKKYLESSRKQTQFLKENFSLSKMSKNLKTYMDAINVVNNVPLQLPKLKKVGGNSTPKLKLPKLKKVEA